MTLRTRLLIGLVVLTAIGLSVAGAVTYREQRSFLLDRVNEQLASALAVPGQFSAAVNNPSTTGRQHRCPMAHTPSCASTTAAAKRWQAR